MTTQILEMPKYVSLKVGCKVWIMIEGKPLLGKGGAAILEQIEKQQSISKAAEKLGMSYRYVWGYLNEARKLLGEPIVQTYKGGKSGGGGARVNDLGMRLLAEYNRISKDIETYITRNPMAQS